MTHLHKNLLTNKSFIESKLTIKQYEKGINLHILSKLTAFIIFGFLLLMPSTYSAAQNLTVKYKLKDSTYNTVIDTESLTKALLGVTEGDITEIEISSGKLNNSDWLWFYNRREKLPLLEKLTVTSGLNSVADIPNGRINKPIFSPSLKNISIAKVNKIGKFAVYNNNSLLIAEFPDTKYIGDFAFQYCTNLITAKFPKLKNVGKYGFHSCFNIAELHLPEKAPTIGMKSFQDCDTNRVIIFVDVNGVPLNTVNTAYTNYKNAKDGNKTDELWYNWKIYKTSPHSIEAVSVANGTVNTPQFAPEGHILKVILNPNHGYTVQSGTLKAYKKNQVASTVSISEKAILTMPQHDIVVECNYTTNSIKATLNGEKVVAGYTLENALKQETLENINSLVISSGYFAKEDWIWLKSKIIELNNLKKFVITDEVVGVENLPNTTSLKPFFNKKLIEIKVSKVRVLGKYAFYSNKEITTATFKDVEVIDMYAFNNSTQLKTIDFPKAKTIRYRAFYECRLLETCNFPKALLVEDQAFKNCRKITIAEFPIVQEFEDQAMMECEALATLLLPETTPKAQSNSFDSYLEERKIVFVDAHGEPLTNVSTAYDNYNNYDEHSSYDGKWLKWNISDKAIFRVQTKVEGEGKLNINPAFAEAGKAIKIIPEAKIGYLLAEGSIKSYKKLDVTTTIAVSPSGENYTLNMPEYNIIVEAKFDLPSYKLTYKTDGNGTIVGKKEQTVKKGESGEKVIATPKSGYRFASWDDGKVSTAERIDNNVISDITVTANFVSTTKYSITYHTSNGGIIIGEKNQNVLKGENGTEVEAKPNENYVFVKWSDGKTDTKRKELNVQNDIEITAEFALKTYKIIYQAEAGGSISGDLIQTIEHGDSTSEVEAIPDIGYLFKKWSDGLLTSKRKETNVDKGLTLKAIFELATYTITYTAQEGGSILGKTTQKIEHGKNGSEVEAKPEEGWVFDKWSDKKTSIKRSETNVLKDEIYTAYFKGKIQEIKYEKIKNGTIKIHPEIEYRTGKKVKIATYANPGYILVDKSIFVYKTEDKSKKVEVNEKGEFIIPPFGVTITCKFELIRYNIKIDEKIKNGSITTNISKNVEPGTIIEITTNPEKGYTLEENSLKAYSSKDKSISVKITEGKFEMPSYDLIITAKFKNKTSIKLIEKKSIRIFPNPANDILYIDLQKERSLVEIFNAKGKQVIRKYINSGQSINISQLTPGLYTIKVGKLQSKLIVQ